MAVSLLANAKVNPTLRVLGRRVDGFHELETTMLALDLADVVTVEALDEAGGVEVSVRGEFATPDVPLDETNLAARGALFARDLVGDDVGLRVEVIKNVPSRAGLGGGSADAAAAARATLVELGEDDAVLVGALGELGSDVAFFHEARATGAAVAMGRGERIVSMDAPADWHVAVITPEVECATPAVYAALGREPGDARAAKVHAARADATALFHGTAVEARARLSNDLEAAARVAAPELEPWFQMFERLGLDHFRLAGSGSSFFGLFDDESSAERAVETIEAEAISSALGVRLSHVGRPAGAALTRPSEGIA